MPLSTERSDELSFLRSLSTFAKESVGMSERVLLERAARVAAFVTGSEAGFVRSRSGEDRIEVSTIWVRGEGEAGEFPASSGDPQPSDAASVANGLDHTDDGSEGTLGARSVRRHLSVPVPDSPGPGTLLGVTGRVTPYSEDDLARVESLARELGRTLTLNRLRTASDEREAYLALLLKQAADVVFELDETGHISSANAVAEQIYGIGPDTFLGRPFHDLEMTSSQEEGALKLDRARSLGMERYEGMHRRCDGSGFECEVTLSFLPWRATFVAMVRDLTKYRGSEAALRESRERYRAVVASMSEGIMIQNREGNIIDCNVSAERILGIPRTELLGLSHTDSRMRLVDEEGSPASSENHPSIIALRERHSVRNVVLGVETPYGQRRWINVSAEPLFQAGEERPYAVMSSFTDITERRAAELRLRHLSRAVEQNPASIVITDTKGRIEYVNANFTLVTGYTAEEVVGRSMSLFKSGLQPSGFYERLWKTILSGKEWRGEFHNRRKNGELFWESAMVAPLFNEAGHMTHFMAIKEDVSERKKVHEQLREQAALLDVSTDAILVLNLARDVTYCNRSVEHIYGWSPQEMMGRNFDRLVLGDGQGPSPAEVEQFMRQGVSIATTRHVTKKGNRIDVQVRATVLRDPEGNPKSIFVVATDVTESKRIESQFLRAQRMESLGSLASGIAHDLNNVLTPIMMAVDLIQDLAHTERDRGVVDMLRDSTRRGADIVKQLLIFGRGSDTPRANVDPCGVLDDLGRLVRETFPRNIVFKTEVGDRLWPIHADRTQIHQILLNLCVNARDALPQGGALVLGAENVVVDEVFAQAHPNARTDSYVRFLVSDSGSGIPADLIEKIFDPFFTTKPVGQGTGLGLSTVLGIVKGHHGFVTVRSQVGQGSEFSVYMPANPSVGQVEADQAVRQGRKGHGELILVIDDEPSIRDLLQRVLPPNNFKVIVAKEGTEGIAMFAQNMADVRLVITDMMMPVMDGSQTIQALRRLKKDLPIIAISGLHKHKADVEKVERARFLAKPFTVDDLLRIVSESIDEAPETSGGIQ